MNLVWRTSSSLQMFTGSEMLELPYSSSEPISESEMTRVGSHSDLWMRMKLVSGDGEDIRWTFPVVFASLNIDNAQAHSLYAHSPLHSTTPGSHVPTLDVQLLLQTLIQLPLRAGLVLITDTSANIVELRPRSNQPDSIDYRTRSSLVISDTQCLHLDSSTCLLLNHEDGFGFRLCLLSDISRVDALRDVFTPPRKSSR